MKEIITIELSNALKNGDKERIHTLRLVLAAIKDKEIANRSSGEDSEISEEVVIQLLKKMVKQRNDSIEMFEKAGRTELAEKEKLEITIINEFLPKQLTEQEIKDIIVNIVQETGSTSIRDMGKIMGELKSEYAGQLDFALAGKLLKELLSSQ